MRLIPSGKSAVDAGAKAIVRIMVGSIVEYEQHGAPNLAIVSGEKKGKWCVQNSKGAQLDLPPDRLYLLPGSGEEVQKPDTFPDSNSRVKFLEHFEQKVAICAESIQLEELWNILSESRTEATVREVSELAFGADNLLHHTAMRRRLLSDTIYFKRGKNTFTLRPPELVAELKAKYELELAEAKRRTELRDAIIQRYLLLQNPDRHQGNEGLPPLPPSIQILEEFAALGKSAPQSKEALSLLEEIEQRTRLSASGAAPERAFSLLVHIGHFSPDEDLSFLRFGRPRYFHKNIMDEVQRLLTTISLESDSGSRTDLRHLQAFTIDGEQTKDRDDALSFEVKGDLGRIGIHISDITPWMDKSDLLEDQARTRGTSIYTADYNVPMLPEVVSEEAFSLLPGSDRLAVSFLITFDSSGRVVQREVCQSVVRITRHMIYQEADSILYGERPGDPLERDLSHLWDLTLQRERTRLDRGAMQFSQREMWAKIASDGHISIIDAVEDTPAHKLVGEMMILGNETLALFAREKNLPMVFRAQEATEVPLETQGLEIPEGPAREFFRRSLIKRSSTSSRPAAHAGLGLECYLQATSPIRRYVDLLNQRQLVRFLQSGEPRYSGAELEELIEVVRKGLDEASLIQRERNRYWIYRYLEQQGKRELNGLIMKTDGPKPLVEIDEVFLLVPFHPCSSNTSVPLKNRCGERIVLTIEQINPRKDQLVLREKSNS